jgi:hypothetical protein
MQLSLRLSFYLKCSLEGYTEGTTMGFWIEIVEACRGNLPRVPWAAGYDPKLLDTIGSLQRHTIGEPYTLYRETTPPLQAEDATHQPKKN